MGKYVQLALRYFVLSNDMEQTLRCSTRPMIDDWTWNFRTKRARFELRIKHYIVGALFGLKPGSHYPFPSQYVYLEACREVRSSS